MIPQVDPLLLHCCRVWCGVLLTVLPVWPVQLKRLEVMVLVAVYENELMSRCSDAGRSRRGLNDDTHTPPPPNLLLSAVD